MSSQMIADPLVAAMAPTAALANILPTAALANILVILPTAILANIPVEPTVTLANIVPTILPATLDVVAAPSIDTDKIHVAGKDFSIRSGFNSWNIKTIDALAKEYPSSAAISSTVGPHNTMHDAMTSILLAHNRSFGLKFYRSTPGNSRSGPKQEIACNCQGCPYNMNYELCTVGSRHGWVLVKSNDVHSDHEMSISLAQKLSSSSTQREIPTHVLVDAKSLYTVGQMDVAKIHSYFEAKFKETSQEVTWTAKDLANALAEDPTTRLFDSTDFLIDLEKRQQEKGLRYIHTVDSDGRLSLVFAEVDGGWEAYKRMGDQVVLFYDTTFGTNR